MKDPESGNKLEGVYEESMMSKDEQSSASSKDKKDKKKEKEQASVSETLSFVFNSGSKTIFLFFLGAVGALGNGLVYPMLAYLFS